ncbi:MAG: Fic family protein [Candidatus Methanomethylophilaceae archaeon]|nr:Fic family protein [Candidatus Methanomethylophilaceae archaeon]
MTAFDYSGILERHVPPNISDVMIKIAVTQERSRIWREQYPDAFDELRRTTDIDATFYSNACEKIVKDRSRVVGYLSGDAPDDVAGNKVLGYSRARDHILSEAGKGTRLSPELLLETERILIEAFVDVKADYRKVDGPHTGKGVMTAVRNVADAERIEELTERFCTSVEVSMEKGIQPLLLIPAAVSDFHYLSPLAHGNGRVSRLLSEYLLVRTGFDMILYQSLDRYAYSDLRRYVSSIYRTSMLRRIDPRESMPFTEGFLECLDDVSSSLNVMFPPPSVERLSKTDRVRHVALKQEAEFTKSDIVPALPGISPTLIQQSLSELVGDGLLHRTGHTKGCRYVIKRQ